MLHMTTRVPHVYRYGSLEESCSLANLTGNFGSHHLGGRPYAARALLPIVAINAVVDTRLVAATVQSLAVWCVLPRRRSLHSLASLGR